jgi:hypothetical protein
MNNDDSPFASLRESPGMPASPIDRAIDRAVRKMMHVDPPAGLRRRVMSRLEAPLPRRSIFRPAFAVPAAVMAVLVLGVMTARLGRVAPSVVEAPPAASVAPPAGDSRVARAPAPAPAAGAVPSRRSRPAAVPPRAGFRREPIPMAPVDDIFGERTNAVAAADATGEAIWTSRGAPDDAMIGGPAPIVVDPVGIAPIETAPIVVAPLGAERPAPAPGGPR